MKENALISEESKRIVNLQKEYPGEDLRLNIEI